MIYFNRGVGVAGVDAGRRTGVLPHKRTVWPESGHKLWATQP